MRRRQTPPYVYPGSLRPGGARKEGSAPLTVQQLLNWATALAVRTGLSWALTREFARAARTWAERFEWEETRKKGLEGRMNLNDGEGI